MKGKFGRKGLAKKGSALVSTVLAMIIMMILGAALVTLALFTYQYAVANSNRQQAFFTARSAGMSFYKLMDDNGFNSFDAMVSSPKVIRGQLDDDMGAFEITMVKNESAGANSYMIQSVGFYPASYDATTGKIITNPVTKRNVAYVYMSSDPFTFKGKFNNDNMLNLYGTFDNSQTDIKLTATDDKRPTNITIANGYNLGTQLETVNGEIYCLSPLKLQSYKKLDSCGLRVNGTIDAADNTYRITCNSLEAVESFYRDDGTVVNADLSQRNGNVYAYKHDPAYATYGGEYYNTVTDPNMLAGNINIMQNQFYAEGNMYASGTITINNNLYLGKRLTDGQIYGGTLAARKIQTTNGWSQVLMNDGQHSSVFEVYYVESCQIGSQVFTGAVGAVETYNLGGITVNAHKITEAQFVAQFESVIKTKIEEFAGTGGDSSTSGFLPEKPVLVIDSKYVKPTNNIVYHYDEVNDKVYINQSGVYVHPTNYAAYEGGKPTANGFYNFDFSAMGFIIDTNDYDGAGNPTGTYHNIDLFVPSGQILFNIDTWYGIGVMGNGTVRIILDNGAMMGTGTESHKTIAYVKDRTFDKSRWNSGDNYFSPVNRDGALVGGTTGIYMTYDEMNAAWGEEDPDTGSTVFEPNIYVVANAGAHMNLKNFSICGYVVAPESEFTLGGSNTLVMGSVFGDKLDQVPGGQLYLQFCKPNKIDARLVNVVEFPNSGSGGSGGGAGGAGGPAGEGPSYFNPDIFFAGGSRSLNYDKTTAGAEDSGINYSVVNPAG